MLWRRENGIKAQKLKSSILNYNDLKEKDELIDILNKLKTNK